LFFKLAEWSISDPGIGQRQVVICKSCRPSGKK
jgi:hypothetical protein